MLCPQPQEHVITVGEPVLGFPIEYVGIYVGALFLEGNGGGMY